MAMTTIITRNASGRMRGFLASCTCEVAPGIYVSIGLNKGVRERIFGVMLDWCKPHEDMAFTMITQDTKKVGGIDIQQIGQPRTEMYDACGIFLAKRDVPEPEPQPEGSEGKTAETEGAGDQTSNMQSAETQAAETPAADGTNEVTQSPEQSAAQQDMAEAQSTDAPRESAQAPEPHAPPRQIATSEAEADENET